MQVEIIHQRGKGQQSTKRRVARRKGINYRVGTRGKEVKVGASGERDDKR